MSPVEAVATITPDHAPGTTNNTISTTTNNTISLYSCGRCHAVGRLPLVDIGEKIARAHEAEMRYHRTGHPADRDSAVRLGRAARKAERRGARHRGCGGAVTILAVDRDDLRVANRVAHELRSRADYDVVTPDHHRNVTASTRFGGDHV